MHVPAEAADEDQSSFQPHSSCQSLRPVSSTLEDSQVAMSAKPDPNIQQQHPFIS